MSSAKTGHSALSADADVRSELLGGLDDDEARGAFVVAAIAHAERQAAVLTEQAVNVADKAEKVIAEWKAKVDEATAIAGRAVDELNAWKDLLDDRTGF